MIGLTILLGITMVSLPTLRATCSDVNILVTSKDTKEIFHVSPTGNVTVVPVRESNIERPIAIDYDPVTSDIYWTDVLTKQIRATNILGRRDRIVSSLNDKATPDGLAVDSSNRKVFYTDMGNDVIAVMDMDGNNTQILIETDLDKPRAIVLDIESRKIYWTDWGSSAYIARADYDGTSITKIVTADITWPNGLALDIMNEVLYWCDAGTDRIESVNVNGRGRRVVLKTSDTHYFDIFLHDATLYFTDWLQSAILSMPARGGPVESFQNISIGLSGIHVFSTRSTSDEFPDDKESRTI